MIRKLLLQLVCTLIWPVSVLHAADTNARPTLFTRAGGYLSPIAVAISPNGRFFVTTGSDGLTIWSTEDGLQYRTFQSYDDYQPGITTIGVASDSETITVADWKFDAKRSTTVNKIHLINARTIRDEMQITPETDRPIESIAASTKQMVLAYMDLAGEAAVLTLKDGHVMFRTKAKVPENYWAGPGGKNLVRDVKFSPDGSLLAITTNQAFELWDWAKNRKVLSYDADVFHSQSLSQPIQVPDGPQDTISCPEDTCISTGPKKMSTHEEEGDFYFIGSSFSPNGRQLALCSGDELHILQIPSGKRLAFRATSPGIMNTIDGCVFKDNDVVFLAQRNLALGVYVRSKQQPGVFHIGLRAYLPVPGMDRGLLLTASDLSLVDPATLEPLESLPAKAGSTDVLAFTGTAELLWHGSETQLISWNLESGEALPVAIPDAEFVSPVVSSDGKHAAAANPAEGDKAHVRFFDLVNKRETTPYLMTFKGYSAELSLSRDGAVVAVADEVGSVEVIDAVKSRRVAALTVDHPTAVAVQPDGTQLAVRDKSGISVYSVSKVPKKVASMPAPDFNIGSKMQYSPDGKWLAVLEVDGLHVYSSAPGANGKLNERLKLPTSGGCFAFSPSSERLAFPFEWNLNSGGGIAVADLEGKILFHDKTGISTCPIAFTRDGQILAVGTEHGAELLSADTGHLVASLFLFGKNRDIFKTAEAKKFEKVTKLLEEAGPTNWAKVNEAVGDISLDEDETQKLLLNLMGDLKGAQDWVVVTPDGLFDGAPAGWRQLIWRLSENTFDIAPVEIFFRNFYRPGLLAEIFSGHVPAAPVGIAGIDTRQPKVQLSSANDFGAPVGSRSTHLKLAVAQASADQKHRNGSGVRDLRLFRNGTLLRAWRGDLQLDKSGTSEFEVDAPIVAGDNVFTAYAFSSADIKSADATVTVVGDKSLRRKGTAYVIAMGVDQYAATSDKYPLDLRYAVADATDFAEQFRKSQTTLHQFAKIHLIPLIGPNATRANLEAVLQALGGQARIADVADKRALLGGLTEVQPEDGLFIFYAGHGVARNGHFYLIPQNYDPNYAFNTPESNTISEVALSHMLEGISPARSFLVIDACHSGQAIATDSPVGPVNSPGLAQLAYEKGLYILAASSASEPALETQKLGGGHGFLTYALVEEGLKTSAAAFEGTVELRSWFTYASRRVPELEGADIARRGFEINDPSQRDARQHPRVFYRREPEIVPFIVAKPIKTSPDETPRVK